MRNTVPNNQPPDSIVVTGMGIISAIGDSVAKNRSALMQGVCGMSNMEFLDSRYKGMLPVGEVKYSNETLKQKLQVNDPSITRTSLLALHAFEEAIHDSQLSSEQIKHGTAWVGATTVAGMCQTEEMLQDAQPEKAGTAFIHAYDYGVTGMLIQKKYGITGWLNTINTACSSSANAIMYGARLIQQGHAERAIVGGFDSLAKFTVNGFKSLQILSPEICRPFDINRRGLNLGEGAAFLVLEKAVAVPHKKQYAKLTGYANANDAFHASSLSEEGIGPSIVMQDALTSASLHSNKIDFINAHGTATENNDLVESIALKKIFTTVPAFVSTKANTGHTLGAAGAIEAVYSILNIVHQERYKGIQFTSPIPETGLRPQPVYEAANILNVLSNSFGFGGNCSSLIFSKI